MLNRMILLVLAGGALWGQSGDFRTTLFPILEKANCRACHNADGVASATRLHFPEADADADKIAAFGNSLVVLVDRQNPDASLLLRKPTARMPHTGGERIKQNSPEEAVLKAWIAKLAQLSGAELAAALKYRELESEGGGAAAGCATAALDPQPVQPHGARSAGRPDRTGDAVSAGGFRQRIPEPVPRAEPFAAAGGSL